MKKLGGADDECWREWRGQGDGDQRKWRIRLHQQSNNTDKEWRNKLNKIEKVLKDI